MPATGTNAIVIISLPLFKKMPHASRSPCPYAWEAKVLIELLMPARTNRPNTFVMVYPSPTPASSAALFIWPMNSMLSWKRNIDMNAATMLGTASAPKELMIVETVYFIYH